MEKERLTAKAVFDRALEIESPIERAAYLDAACAGAPALRRKVAALLRAYADAGNFLESPAVALFAGAEEASSEGPGTVIGPYKLLEQIGEGGFGVVFMADQLQPIRRKVALKVLKPGMDSRQVLARFEAERQALALMDHPNIARVLDAGTTPGVDATRLPGRPYFVMELVRGVAITDYSDQNQLTPRERLEIFVPVCRAVQHAHQKGIIHRDLKPSNILVTRHDGVPVAKVIDFGIAKALGQQLTDKTLFTGFGQLVGTPTYMSPEQADLTGVDIDTRTDIYSLGVLLYELLTGTTPFDKERLSKVGYDELRRIVREEEPPKPSTRLSTMGPVATAVSARRQSDPRRLGQDFRGELDWIVMKTLEKDRTRRYETVAALVADVERYLRDEPVEACPPSLRYKLGKFVARHKARVVAGSLLLLALLLGFAGTTFGLVRAEQQRQEAEQAREREARRAEGERMAKEEAFAREAEMRAVLEFVENKVFVAARPKNQEGGQGYDVKLADALKAALPFVEKAFTQQPLNEARLRMTLGRSFHSLGESKISADQFQKAHAIFTKHRGPDHPDTLWSMGNLAVSYRELGRIAEALSLDEETVARRKAIFGPDDPETLASMAHVPLNYAALGRHEEAVKLLEETLRLMRAKLGPDHHHTLWSMGNLGSFYRALGRHADARELLEETLALQIARLGRDDIDTLRTMTNLAISYDAPGRYMAAIRLHEEAVELKKAKLGPDHPDTLWGMNNLAWLLAVCPDAKFRDPKRAAELAKETVEHAPQEGNYWNTLAVAQYRAGDWKAAVAALNKSENLLKGKELSFNAFFLAMAHSRLGQENEARKWYDKAVQWMEKHRPHDEQLRRFRAEAEEVLAIERPANEEPELVPAPRKNEK